MPDTKFSALSSGSPAVGTDVVAIARAGANYKLTLAQILAYGGSPVAGTTGTFSGNVAAATIGVGINTPTARPDAGIEIAGLTAPNGGPGLSLYLTDNVGTTVGETFIAFSAKTDASVITKTASISAKWADPADANGRGVLRFNVTYQTAGVQQNDIYMRAFGNYGVAVFGASDTVGPGPSIFDVTGTVRARTKLLAGTAADAGDVTLQAITATAGWNAAFLKNADATAGTATMWNAATTGDNRFVNFFTEAAATARGSIDFDRAGTATRYNTTSDQRLKVDRGVATDCSRLEQTPVHDFEWTATGTSGRGVFAQEVYPLLPIAVSVGDDEKKIPWGVDYSKFVPDLIVGWQSHNKALADITAKYNDLVEQVSSLKS